jgi:DNA-binding MarR family transcriptional regulator
MTIVKTKSQATVDAYTFLAANKGTAYTIKAVAEALNVTSAKLVGGLVSLAKKGILTKEDAEVEGKPYKTFAWAEEATFEFDEVKNISDKAVQVLTYLQNNPGDATAADIAATMGVAPIAVNGVVNGLVKRGLVERVEVTVEAPDGTSKAIKFVKLTEDGTAYTF